MKTKFLTLNTIAAGMVFMTIMQSCEKASEAPIKPQSHLETNVSAINDYVVTTVAGFPNTDPHYIDGPLASAGIKDIYQLFAGTDGTIYFPDRDPDYLKMGIRAYDGNSLTTIFSGAIAQNPASGTAMDKDGNFYVIDYYDPWVRKVTPAGKVTTLAGCDRNFEYAHIDGPVSKARFAHLVSITAANDGNVYVGEVVMSEQDDNKPLEAYIRKITPNGTVTTLAGGPIGNTDGQGLAARFGWVGNLFTAPNGNIYFLSNESLKIMTPTGLVTTIKQLDVQLVKDGPLASAGIYIIRGMTFTPDGTIYFTGWSYSAESILVFSVRKISIDNIVSTIAGGVGENLDIDGPGLTARFNSPEGIVYSSTEHALYVADHYNYKLKKITLPE